MCLISVCPKGTKKYTEEVEDFIISGFNCNRHGSGFMYKKNGESVVHIKKGFFVIQELFDAIVKADLQDDDELVIHHRISTGGNTNDENCHPFVISPIHEEVVLVDGNVDKPCLAHNGVFHSINKLEALDRSYSDTYAFCRYVLSNSHLLELFKDNTELFKTVLDNILSWSRLAVLFPDRDLLMTGDFKEKNGYYHSNEGFCRYVYNKGGVETDDNEEEEMTVPLVRSGGNEKIGGNLSPKTLSLYPPLRINGCVIQSFIRLDGTIIRITEDNYKNFFYVRKNDMLHNNPFIFEDSAYVEYNTDDTKNILTLANIKNRGHAVTNSQLHDNYWFYPKPMWQNVYKDYLHIIRQINESSGKKTVKNLYKVLNKIKVKSASDKIFWKRLGENIYIMAMVEWYNYWKKYYKQLDVKHCCLPFNAKVDVGTYIANQFNEVGPLVEVDDYEHITD